MLSDWHLNIWYSPMHRCLSSTKPGPQEHLKLPSVLRHTPFSQMPCIWHSLMSSRSKGTNLKWWSVLTFTRSETRSESCDSPRLTLTVCTVESFVSLRTRGAVVFHDVLFDWRIWQRKQNTRWRFYTLFWLGLFSWPKKLNLKKVFFLLLTNVLVNLLALLKNQNVDFLK